MPSKVMRVMVSPSSRFRDVGRRRQFAAGVEDESAVGVDAHFDLGARLPVVDARGQADPDAEADIDMDEAF